MNWSVSFFPPGYTDVQTIDACQAAFLPIGASASLLIMFLFFDSLQMVFAICTAGKLTLNTIFSHMRKTAQHSCIWPHVRKYLYMNLMKQYPLLYTCTCISIFGTASLPFTWILQIFSAIFGILIACKNHQRSIVYIYISLSLNQSFFVNNCLSVLCIEGTANSSMYWRLITTITLRPDISQCSHCS